MRLKAAAYGRALTVIDEPEATALGAALLGGLAAQVWPDMDAAQFAIAQPRHVIEPEAAWVTLYDDLFESVHRRFYATVAPLSHALSSFDRAHSA
jgi:xylulokinase